MKATGIVRRIDDLGRVVIPKEIRRTMRIREGDPLEIFTDKDGELIFKKYSPIGELSDFAAQICESLRKTAELTAAVCDRDSLIAVSGSGRRELLEKPVSRELRSIMDSRASYCRKKGSRLPVSSADEKFSLSAAEPIISEGDVMGCVIFVAPDGSAEGTELQVKLARTVAMFLGKQMEG